MRLELSSGAGWGRSPPGHCLQPACAQASGCPAQAQHLGLLWPQEEKGAAGKLLLGEPNSYEEREGMDLVLPLSRHHPLQCQPHLLMETQRKKLERQQQMNIRPGCGQAACAPSPPPPKSSPAVKHFRADRNHTQPSHNPICKAAFQ